MQMFDWDKENNRNRKYGTTYDYIDVFHLIIITLLSNKNKIQNMLEHLSND